LNRGSSSSSAKREEAVERSWLAPLLCLGAAGLVKAENMSLRSDFSAETEAENRLDSGFEASFGGGVFDLISLEDPALALDPFGESTDLVGADFISDLLGVADRISDAGAEDSDLSFTASVLTLERDSVFAGGSGLGSEAASDVGGSSVLAPNFVVDVLFNFDFTSANDSDFGRFSGLLFSVLTLERDSVFSGFGGSGFDFSGGCSGWVSSSLSLPSSGFSPCLDSAHRCVNFFCPKPSL